MQLMRNLCITDPQRNLERKIQEAELALEYEKKFSKEDILGKYLNTASYGTINGWTAVGVQAASRIFFSKPVWKLNLSSRRCSPACRKRPRSTTRSSIRRRRQERRNEVLARMANRGYISATGREASSRARTEALRHLLRTPDSPTSSTTSRTN